MELYIESDLKVNNGNRHVTVTEPYEINLTVFEKKTIDFPAKTL